MDKIDRFCEQLSAAYAEHHLAPSLIFSNIPKRGSPGERQGYVSIHTFPNGMNSRQIICNGIGDTLEQALDECIAKWCMAQALLKGSVPS